MKIGSTEFSLPTLVYMGIILALALLIPGIVLSHWGAMREAWLRGTIVNATVEGGDALSNGVDACRTLIAADPSKVAPRLHLGCLLARLKKYKEAREAFEQVRDVKSATPEELSLALTGAGCAASLDGATDGKPVHLDEAEKLIQDALTAAGTPDALAAMALLKSWKSGGNGSDVEALIKKAFDAAPAPAPALLTELYKLNGSILARNGLPDLAANAFLGAKALDPGNLQMDEAARLTKLASLTRPGMKPEERRKAIDSTALDLEKFGKSKGDAHLAIGMAWHALKDEEDYGNKDGPFTKAGAEFKKMIDINPKDIRGYKYYTALQDERIAKLSSELSVPVTGLKGETPVHGAGSFDPAVQPSANGEAAGPAGALTKDDQEKLAKIQVLLSDELNMWVRLLGLSDLAKEEKINARLRLISCYRRKYLAATATKPLRRDPLGNTLLDPADQDNMKLALASAAELAGIDDSGHGHYEQALIAIEKGDLAMARSALMESAKRGFETKDQQELLAKLGAKPKLVDMGPVPGERAFGTRPLIRAAFETPLGPSFLKGFKVSLDGKTVASTVFGSQVLYLPEADLSSGTHAVKITADDPGGAPLELPGFSFAFDKNSIDENPPAWKITPDGGTVKSDVVFSVALATPSVFDVGALSVIVGSTDKNAQPYYNKTFIKNGQYTVTVPALDIKTGQKLLVPPFKLSDPEGLPPGNYTLSIKLRAPSGKDYTYEKKFTVGK